MIMLYIYYVTIYKYYQLEMKFIFIRNVYQLYVHGGDVAPHPGHLLRFPNSMIHLRDPKQLKECVRISLRRVLNRYRLIQPSKKR